MVKVLIVDSFRSHDTLEKRLTDIENELFEYRQLFSMTLDMISIADIISSTFLKRFKSLFSSTNDGICLHEIIYKDNIPVDYRLLE